MEARFTWAVLGLSISFVVPALGDEPATRPPRAEPGVRTEHADYFGHGLQFGLRAGLVGGYNMILRYDQSPLCAAYKADKAGKDQQKFCGHGAPLAMDLALSFAPLDFVEPYLFLRLGLAREVETDTLPLKVVGAGARIYTMSDSRLKIFVEPALAWELEHGGSAADYRRNRPAYKNDLLIHLAAGAQFDFAKYVGVFVDAGLTTGVLRSIHSELELQGGVQARFP